MLPNVWRSASLARILLRPALSRGYFKQGQEKDGTEVVPEKDLYVAKDESVRFMRECMISVGSPESHSQRLALNLLAADCRGHFSHGLNRLAMYVTDVKSGHCRPEATPVIIKESAGTAVVDGKDGLGVVVGEFSMNLAISKARSSGIGWVSAKRSNHFGICQWYVDMALEQGMMGIASTNTSPLVAPTRGKDQIFGTNPISIGAPGSREGDRFLLDMSTSAVAVGKIEMQMRKHEPLPSDSWSLGADGKPTTDAHEAFFKGQGLLPLGGTEINSGYKGYGLGMAVELICGLMSGAEYAHNVRKWTNHEVPANLGHCFVAIDPGCFDEGMKDRLQTLMDHLRNLDPVDPKLPVLVPGDPERNSSSAVDKSGGAIKYTPDHIISYRKLAKELGVEPMKSFRQ